MNPFFPFRFPRLALYSLLVALSGPVTAQENLMTVNPSFLSNVNGWSDTGSGTLSHFSEGALSNGAARLQVSSAGNISSAALVSPEIELPASLQGTLLYLTLQARSGAGTADIRLRIDIQGAEQQLSDEWHLTDAYRKYGMPIFVPQNARTLQIRVQCGLEAGAYFFDDFFLKSVRTDPADIRQFDPWEPKQFERPAQVMAAAQVQGTADVQLTLFPEKVIAPVLSTQFGVNSNFRSGNSLVNRTDLYRPFGSFRFPAGSGSNQYFWDCRVPPQFAIEVSTLCGTGNQYLHPDNFIAFKNNAQGEATVVVNYFYARYGLTPQGTRAARVQQAADYAAGLVQYLNVERGAGIKYWEVGNECYGPWETGYEINGNIVTGKEYGEDFRVFAEAMKAVDPSIQVGAVLSHKEFGWNNEVLPEVQEHADFLIVHHYFEVSGAAAAATALQEIDNDMQEIQAAVAAFTDKPAGYFPIAFTEFNIQGPSATNIINGLFIAEALGTIVRNKFTLANIWVNEWNIDAEYHSKGLLAQNDRNQPDYTPRPAFTPYYYFYKYFGDQLIEHSLVGNSAVRAYASTFNSGETGVVLVNYSNQNLKISIAQEGMRPAPDSLFWHVVHADNTAAGNTKFYVNGLTGNTVGGGPALDQAPAFAAAYDPVLTLAVPRFSAAYIALSKGKISSTGGAGAAKSPAIYPNPTNGLFYLPAVQEPLQIFDISGRDCSRQVSIEGKGLSGYQINAGGLPSGLYFVKSGVQVMRLVKN